ncbi:unnamed protein product, partial [marine sediment metagenome]
FHGIEPEFDGIQHPELEVVNLGVLVHHVDDLETD